MRIVVILATHNEELFIRPCLRNYISQGIEAYIIDNDSSDSTVARAREFIGNGLIGIEKIPRDGFYRWEPILRRKEEIADAILADWYIHADPDEIRLPPAGYDTLSRAIHDVDHAGFNAINFDNFLFLPTTQSPDHEHEQFEKTMLWYRFLDPTGEPNQIKGWRRQHHFASTTSSNTSNRRTHRSTLSLAMSGGHQAIREDLRLCPTNFTMKHYQVLSLRHAVRKYARKQYAADELARGWHGWKGTVGEQELRLPDESEMRLFVSNDQLDKSDPIKRTLLYDQGQE